MLPLDILSFTYPTMEGKGKDKKAITKEYTCIVLSPLYAGKMHALKLDDLDSANVMRIVGFLWPDEYGSVAKTDPYLRSVLAGYSKEKARTPREFYHMYIKRLLQNVPVSVYRIFLPRYMRNIRKLRVNDILT